MAVPSVFSVYDLDLNTVLDDLELKFRGNTQFKSVPNAFQSKKVVGRSIMMCCPYHDDSSPSFGVGLDPPYPIHCFGCGVAGTIENLVSYVLDISEIEAMQYINREYLFHHSNKRRKIDLDRILRPPTSDDRNKPSVSEEDILQLMQFHHPYWLSRGIPEFVQKKYEVGYDPETECITIPIRDITGSIRFIKRRSIANKRFLNEKGVYKKDILYGLFYLAQSKKKITEIYLVESEIDTISCYCAKMPSSALMGRIIYEEQIKVLMSVGIRTINLFLDNDQPGQEAVLQIYDKLKSYPIRVNVVMYPEYHYGLTGTDAAQVRWKDANDLWRAGMLDRISLIPMAQYILHLSR